MDKFTYSTHLNQVKNAYKTAKFYNTKNKLSMISKKATY